MKKKAKLFFGLILIVIGALSLLMFAACGNNETGGGGGTGGEGGGDGDTPAHTHTLVAHEKVDATCSAAGTEAYWQCSGCNLYFSDANGTKEITAPKAIEKADHSFTVMQYEGNEHWTKCAWCDEITGKETHAAAGEMVMIVEQQPTKKAYFVGETFDPTGLKVIVECYVSCGYSIDVTQDVTIADADKPLEAGTTSMTVTYEGNTSVIGITVSEVTIVSVDVELKDGVAYFNNGLAIPKPADFTVTAHYNDNTERVLDEDEYTVAVSIGFDTQGGTITVKPVGYNNLDKVIDYELVEVALDSLTIKTNPANTTFRTGEEVSLEGMVLLATYNDGETVEITEGYVCEAEGETYATEQTVTATISYTDNGVTKTCEIEITISDNDGALVGIAFAEGASYSVYAGAGFVAADVPAVYGVRESGRKELLEADEYELTMPTGAAVMGNVYKVTATLKDTDISVDLAVKILTKKNGNQYSTLVGGSTNTKSEKEYVVGEDGTITETSYVVPYVGGFSKVAEAGGDAYVIWSVESSVSAPADITFRAANSYLKNTAEGFTMDALQINSIADLFVNGEKVEVPDSVVLRGCGPHSGYAPLYNIYYTFTIDGLVLSEGTNEIKLQFKNSTLGQKNHWNETPSTMNIDYIEVATFGSTGTAADATVESIIVSNLSVAYGNDREDALAAITVLGVMSDGSRSHISLDDVDVTVTGDESKDWFVFGAYSVTVSLKADSAIQQTFNYELEAYTVFEAYGSQIVEEDGNVYAVFIFDCVNDEEYVTSDFDIFDGSRHLAIVKLERDAKYLYVYTDPTSLGNGDFYVHAQIKGELYDNGEHKANNAGDFKDTMPNSSTVTRAIVIGSATVTKNGKVYGFRKQYNMAIITVADAA